ncbi:glycosyltransferase family 8 protein [Alteromonas sp. a30]|uniref:glycosyltransferase family 8 protein n=1 Tax=Alteromonas sp. a30 TaxID=2730917 RepID=UPI00227FB6ED|nr:glycosyltransferase [Alteromonas sp. a30]MCY7296698.1 hypothetical protein [Alteromonas sp. a30]
MKPFMSPHYCLATVTTFSFLPGTMVLLSSFLETNPWFHGDVVIFVEAQALAPQELNLLNTFKNLKIVHIKPELLKNIKQLTSLNPAVKGKSSHFYSLEVFGLVGYDKVLFCDSDLLFLGSVEPLFSQEQPLICCGDGAYYQGLTRHKQSFVVGKPSTPEEELTNTFNAGFMLIDKSLINSNTYADLVELTHSKHWMDKTTPHTDQRIFNQYFAGKQHIISPVYNYLLTHKNSIEAMYPCDFKDINVLHFNGPNKPWRLTHTLCAITQSPFLHLAFQHWHKRYGQLMTKLHLNGLISKEN